MDGGGGGGAAGCGDASICMRAFNDCQHSVANKEICAGYNVPSKPLKSITNTLDLHCGDIADRIRSALPHQSTSSLAAPSKPYPNTRLQLQASLKRSPTKSAAMKGKAREQELTPSN